MTLRTLAVVAMFVGPAAAAVDLALSYGLVYPAQASGSKMWLHVVTAVAAAFAVAGTLLSVRVLRARTEHLSVDRFLAVVGIALNAFFLLVIVGMAVPKLGLSPTD